MQRVVLVVFAIMLILPLPLGAQNESFVNGCDERVVEAIAPTTDVLDYAAACAQYRACDPAEYGDALCQFQSLVLLLEQCPLDGAVPEDRCHDGALLMAAAMLAINWPVGNDFAFQDRWEAIGTAVPQALAAYWRGDDGEALALYQQFQDVTIARPRAEQMLSFSRAVLHARQGSQTAALREYDYGFGIYFSQPLLSYGRSQLYASQGRMDEAAIDVIDLAAFVGDDPLVADFVADLAARYPLDAMALGNWLLYPVGRGNTMWDEGQYLQDRSLDAPRPIRFAVLDAANLIAAVGIRNWTPGSFSEPDYSVLYRLRGEAGGDTFTYEYPEETPELGSTIGGVTLTRDGDTFTGREAAAHLMVDGHTWDFIIAPAGVPDPRAALDAQRVCPGGVASRMDIGSQVIGAADYAPGALPMAAAPGGELVIPETMDVYHAIVVGGPECVGDVTWWQGYSSAGATGWFPENDGRTYTARPYEVWSGGVYCGRVALLTRLTVGEGARVAAGMDARTLRDFPSADGAVVGSIPAEGVMGVIGGPACTDGVAWWYVDYDGLAGWTVEGEGDVYWLEPVE